MKKTRKALFGLLISVITFCFFVTTVYGKEVNVMVIIDSTEITPLPNPAVVGNGDRVTWGSYVLPFHPMPTHIKIVVPPCAVQQTDQYGNIISDGFDSGKVSIGTPIKTLPLVWKPDAKEVKYKIEIYDEEGNVRILDPYLQREGVGGVIFPVGGVVVPVDKFGLLAPYIALASTILGTTVATAIYVKHVKHREKKQ